MNSKKKKKKKKKEKIKQENNTFKVTELKFQEVSFTRA